MGTSPRDALDRGIIYHLQENARRSITDIANDLGVADNTVRNRMQRLESDGVIKGYQVNVDYDQVGVQHYYIFSCSARVGDRERLAEKVSTLDGVVEVITLMTGKENVFIIAVCYEKDAMTNLATQLDQLGLIIEREHLIRDHTRHPFSGFLLENNL